MAELNKRIFMELTTYQIDLGFTSRALINIDEIAGVIECTSNAHCNTTILLSGGNSIDVEEYYDDIVEKLEHIRNLTN